MSLVATNAFLWINNIDLSQHAKSVTINYNSEMQDATTFGQTFRVMKGGLKTWSFDIAWLESTSTGGPEQSLFGLIGTTACFEYRQVNACSSVNNPSYFGICTVENLPQTAQIGTLFSATTKLTNFGTLNRASSS